MMLRYNIYVCIIELTRYPMPQNAFGDFNLKMNLKCCTTQSLVIVSYRSYHEAIAEKARQSRKKSAELSLHFNCSFVISYYKLI